MRDQNKRKIFKATGKYTEKKYPQNTQRTRSTIKLISDSNVNKKDGARKFFLQTKGPRDRRQEVQHVRTRKADCASHSVNVPKVLNGKKEYMEGREEKICMAQYHHKVNTDIVKIRLQKSNLYEKYRFSGIV